MKKSNISKVQLSIFILTFITFISVLAVVIRKSQHSDKEKIFGYKIIELKKSPPLLFKGIVQPKKTTTFNLDTTLGKLTNIAVQDGQQVKEGDVLATYQNTTIEEQAEEQSQSLDKLNLAVSNAQTILTIAEQKKQEITNKLVELKREYEITKRQNQEEETKREELKTKIEATQQSLDNQNDVVLQAQQSLETAMVDLSTTNNGIEKAQKKIMTTVTIPFEGIIYINEKGKTDNITPFATLVSPETMINGFVSEYDYKELHKDQKVIIRPSGEKKAVEGTIVSINKLPDNSNTDSSNSKGSISNYSFFVDPKENIQYGYNVEISLPIDKLEIPNKAVIKQTDDAFFVFLYKNGKSYKRKVALKDNGSKYLVENGLNENDQLILNPDNKLKDAEEVTVIK